MRGKSEGRGDGAGRGTVCMVQEVIIQLSAEPFVGHVVQRDRSRVGTTGGALPPEFFETA